MFLSKKILLASVCSCLAVNTVVALPFALFIPSVQAQSRRVRYVPPSNLDAPKVSSAGATRSACTVNDCLIALTPDLNLDNAPIPQTIAERPTIYFLSPKLNSPVQFILYEVVPAKSNPEGRLLASRQRKIYEKTFVINNDAGIIALKLPDDSPILEIGKNYTWKFTVNPKSFYSDKLIKGNLRRVLPTQRLLAKLQSISSQPLERAALFAEEGIWFEAVQALAEAQLTVPKNAEILSEWNSLLKSANLDRVMPFSFVSQKQSQKP
jgi:hypothetical protein